MGETLGQGWLQFQELGLAFILSALIGLEREIKQKSAGLRTYTLVGFASALIMLVSKYGFSDVLSLGRVELDPSRVAAQVVSGIGFIGGGLIFVRSDSVRGLTTAATIWITAAIGMACGAGLMVLAVVATVGNFIVIFLFPHIVRKLPKSGWSSSSLEVTYEDGKGVLRAIIGRCTALKFSVARLSVERDSRHALTEDHSSTPPELSIRTVAVHLDVEGTGRVENLVDQLTQMNGVQSVKTIVSDSLDDV